MTFDFDYSRPANWPLEAANALVRKITAEAGVDRGRIYITGLSMGGMGTFESVYRYPELYAAAVPICGGGNASQYDARVRHTAFRIFHGDQDAVVNVQLSRVMAERLKALKVNMLYREYPGVNHNSWDPAFAEPDFLKWIFQQKRKAAF